MDSRIVDLAIRVVRVGSTILIFLTILFLFMAMDSLGIKFEWVGKGLENSSVLCATIAGIFATLMGIAVPISLNIVSNHLMIYKSPEISALFFKEQVFTRLRWSIFLIILCFIIILFKINHLVILLFVVGWAIWALLLFRKFIIRVNKYATSTDEIVEKYAKKLIDKSLNSNDK